MSTQSNAISTLRELVAIPSVNPMGRSDLPPDLLGELRCAEFVAGRLRALGVAAEVVGQGERRSVVGVAESPSATETVMVASHLDTVPVDGMTIPPFDPAIRDGRVYGRGSCDTKAGLAALLAAVERVLARGRLRRNLVIVGEADEESRSVGVRDVLAHLGSRRPRWVLATEPTGLRLITRHKGKALLRLEARGVACHASHPEQGQNAIVALSRAVLTLEALAARHRERADVDLGRPTLSVGLVGGGQGSNVVPDEAWALVDRRLLPGESPETAALEITDALRRDGLDDAVRVESAELTKPPLDTPADHPSVSACLAALRTRGLDPRPGVAAYATDAGLFAAHGIPGVVLGPGDIAQAHAACEFVSMDEVETMVDLFVTLLG